VAGKTPAQTTVEITEDHKFLVHQRIGRKEDDTGASRMMYESKKALKRATLLYAAVLVGNPSKWLTKIFDPPLSHGDVGVVSLQHGETSFVVYNNNGTYYYANVDKSGNVQQAFHFSNH
jgi:hypothetical protein